MEVTPPDGSTTCPLCGGPAFDNSRMSVVRSFRCRQHGIAFLIPGTLLVYLAAPERRREREALAARVCASYRTGVAEITEELAKLGLA